jgi:hypothetical protein
LFFKDKNKQALELEFFSLKHNNGILGSKVWIIKQ